MPATLVATKGGATSNSYATVAEANTYLDDIYGAEEWNDLGDESKTRLLLTATRMIEKFAHLYDPAADTQALKFPVDNTDDATEDGFDEAKEAAILQAFYLYRNAENIAEATSTGIQGVKSEIIGPTQRVITGLNPLKKYDSDVFRLLAGFIELGFTIERG